MKTVFRIPIVAVMLMFLLWSCTHTKKETVETAEVTEEGIESVEVDEDVLEELPVEVVSNLSNIYFEFDSAALQVQATEELQKIGAWLTQNPDTKIRIEGNCDERGTDEYNLALGERRAVAAKNYLVSLGISPKNIITISFGEENPADPSHNEAAWAKNRRDEFNIIE
jgi:peptidoglycan-associated lipoprotein